MSELDQALRRFQQGGLEYGGGLANHGPMAAEALESLGHPALIPSFVDVYAPRLGLGESGRPIEADARSDALGNGADADWVATFLSLLDQRPWRPVLAEWLPVLLPGLFASAVHGALRTAHAVRATEREETPERVREIAHGLGYWASRFQSLPGRPGSDPTRGLGPAALIDGLVPLPWPERDPGFFDEAVRVLDGREDFARAIARLDLDAGEPSEMLSSLCATAAGLYLANPEMRIAYAHCVTGPSALRFLADHVSPARLRAGVGFAARTVAALHVTHAVRSVADAPEPDPECVRLADQPAETRYRAACSAEEHAIELAEACLREDAIRPDRRLRLAAADAAIAIGATAGARGG